MPSGEWVEIVEVGPRDGLQAEPEVLQIATRVELIRRCLAAGVRRIEVASFVKPSAVPQMVDAEAVVAAAHALPERRGASLIGLVLNRRGVERALDTALDEVNVVVPVSDTFSERNQGTDSAGMVQEWSEISSAVAADGRSASVVLSTAFGCPYEGEVPPERLADVARRVAQFGPKEITLADTIGVAVPGEVRRRLDVVAGAIDAVGARTGRGQLIGLRVHVHDTRNTGVASSWAAVEWGVRSLDASLGGLGGCPFAPNATGNVATEDVAFLLERSGYPTGLDLASLADAVRWLEDDVLGRRLPGLFAKAGPFPSRGV